VNSFDNPSLATVHPSQLGLETDIDGEITTYKENNFRVFDCYSTNKNNNLIKIVQNSDSFAIIS
jgi:hypothetical protein